MMGDDEEYQKQPQPFDEVEARRLWCGAWPAMRGVKMGAGDPAYHLATIGGRIHPCDD